MSNSNLPWILINIEMSLNDVEMKLKMMEAIKLIEFKTKQNVKLKFAMDINKY